METNTHTPQAIDTELADLFHEAYRLEDRIAMLEGSAKMQAGAKYYYRGRRRVTDMGITEAEEILAADIAAHSDDKYGYALVRGGGNIGSIRRTIESLAEARKALREVRRDIDRLQDLYTGWSRFFLVTSSKGHIHSSMHCSTCRHTTRYGWLPTLSGQSEAEAVEAQGPALCSVCFPSAPVEWTTEKITKSQAERSAR